MPDPVYQNSITNQQIEFKVDSELKAGVTRTGIIFNSSTVLNVVDSTNMSVPASVSLSIGKTPIVDLDAANKKYVDDRETAITSAFTTANNTLNDTVTANRTLLNDAMASSGLTAAGAYVKSTTYGGYINAANSLSEADEKLNGALMALESKVSAGVSWKSSVDTKQQFLDLHTALISIPIGDVRIIKETGDAFLRIAAGTGENFYADAVLSDLGSDYIRFMDSVEILSGISVIQTELNTVGASAGLSASGAYNDISSNYIKVIGDNVYSLKQADNKLDNIAKGIMDGTGFSTSSFSYNTTLNTGKAFLTGVSTLQGADVKLNDQLEVHNTDLNTINTKIQNQTALTNATTFNGLVSSGGFKTTTGTNLQYLMADGTTSQLNLQNATVDNNIVNNSTTYIDMSDMSLVAYIAGTYLINFNGQYYIPKAYITTSFTSNLGSSDLDLIYNDLINLTTTNTHILTFGDNEVLLPGVYLMSGAISISGALILSGDANSIFVIRTDAAISFAASATVILQGGVLHQNIFWVANAAIALGVGVRLSGTLISNTAAISIGESCFLNGARLFSRGGAIAIGSSTISIPSKPGFINLRTLESFVIFVSTGSIAINGDSVLTGNISIAIGSASGITSNTLIGIFYPAGSTVIITQVYHLATFGLFVNDVLLPFTSRIKNENNTDIILQGVSVLDVGDTVKVKYMVDAQISDFGGLVNVNNRILTITKNK